ncbi:hypothetical protein KAW65_04920 [candidate division WOR-3 bacterium]|nr:hypothetical protein [candidate division WOR-3 bacterium]
MLKRVQHDRGGGDAEIILKQEMLKRVRHDRGLVQDDIVQNDTFRVRNDIPLIEMLKRVQHDRGGGDAEIILKQEMLKQVQHDRGG